ncbi:MAG: hypothetical protein HZB79_00770 [Deltaproteobacteria bacterium]|nr:hypothetical protein [Deltaproteobacteria bacterium]
MKKKVFFGLPKCDIVIVCFIFLSVMSFIRNGVWLDDITLWVDVVRKSPYKVRSVNFLGAAYFERNQFSDAVFWFRYAVGLDSNNFTSRNNLALALQLKGDVVQSLQQYKSSLALNFSAFNVHVNLGTLYLDIDRCDDAMNEFQQAIVLGGDKGKYLVSLNLDRFEELCVRK